jgi:flagellar biosynthesis/type III secretory pathway protein FliH
MTVVENHWLRKKIEAHGTKHPVEVSSLPLQRVRIEMDEIEAEKLWGNLTDDDHEMAYDEGYTEGQARGYDEGLAEGPDEEDVEEARLEGKEEGIEEGEKVATIELLTEALLASRDGRLHEWLVDTARRHEVTR